MPDVPQTEAELRALNAELMKLIRERASSAEIAEMREEIKALKALLTELKAEKIAEAQAGADAREEWQDEFDS